MTKTLVVAAGGTGGHLFPALAVAQQLRRQAPEWHVAFVGGTRGLESHLVPAHGFELHTLAAGQFKGSSAVGRLRTLAGLAPALLRALHLLSRLRPSVVLGAGGYASAPMVAAANLWRVPVVLLEQNAVAGLANRLLARTANRVVTAFADTRGLPAERVLQLGNPVRPELSARLGQCTHERQTRVPRRVLVLGGSQGARRINELMAEAAPQIACRAGPVELIHQTGSADRDTTAAAYRAAGVQAQVEAFIEDMGSAYCAADLMVGRSGATTVAELAVAGLPALFIPYPYAADDHQAANARALAEARAAVVHEQTQLTADRLARAVTELLLDGERLRQMSQAMLAWGRPGAATAVVDLLLELAQL